MRNIKAFIKRKMNRRFRLSAAFLFAFFIIAIILVIIPTVVPRYMFTVGDKVSVLTPRGFKLGQLYDFYTLPVRKETLDAPVSDQKELVLPRPDNRQIVFRYPQVVSLGRPTYLGNDISQSVDFSIMQPTAAGLIQIWVMTNSLESFLEASRKFSNIEYLTFEARKDKKGELTYFLWDYTFKSQDKIIRGLEAFFDDPPYMYRISIFLDNKDYDDKIQKIFDEMVNSVTVK